MNKNTELKAQLCACLTILIWGTTFISTKLLLQNFTPIEILFIRFLLGFVALWLVYPKSLKLTERKQEWWFVAAGLCGVTLYYLFENIALTFTLASNVGVIISIAPFFTAIFNSLFQNGGKLGIHFIIGFVLAIAGICFISFGNGVAFALNPIGDILAMVAAIIWAIYGCLTKKISNFGYNTIQTTRRTFFYGLIFMVPVLMVDGFDVEIVQLANATNLLNLLFLGLGASALCFVTWNFSVKKLGPVRTSVYIYLVPVITTVTSAIILHEQITWSTVFGIALTLLGLSISGSRKAKEIFTHETSK